MITTKRLALVLLVALCALPLAGCVTTIHAQSLPVTKTLAWDASPASDGVLNYIVKDNGVLIGEPTGTTQAVTFATTGTHVLTVVAVNLFTQSLPATLTVNVVVPAPPSNPRIQ